MEHSGRNRPANRVVTEKVNIGKPPWSYLKPLCVDGCFGISVTYLKNQSVVPVDLVLNKTRGLSTQATTGTQAKYRKPVFY